MPTTHDSRHKLKAFGTLVAMLAIAVLPGCSMMDYLKPHQLYKLNRQPAPRSDFDYFSIPDPPRNARVQGTPSE